MDGAFASPTRPINPETIPGKRTRTFQTTVPPTTKGPTSGKTKKTLHIDGKAIHVTIPRGLRSGDSFTFSIESYETDKIFATTLPTIPGMEVISSKPIVYASASRQANNAPGYDHKSMAEEVSHLMQRAQKQLSEEVIRVECNACLGMAFNITNDSLGDTGRGKMVLVTVTGTPCVVVPAPKAPPVAQAEVLITPLYQGSEEFGVVHVP